METLHDCLPLNPVRTRAVRVAKIEAILEWQNPSAAAQILAGLRFDDEDLISRMRDSMIAHKILREGVQIG